MADNFTITASNSVVILTVENMYPSGIRLQNFSADTAFATEDQTVAEARMGVDGHMAAGYTPTPINVTIALEASSPSYEQLANLLESEQTNQAVYKCTLQITVPSRGKEWTLSNGVLLSGRAFPDAKKVLDPTQWKFVFESCKSSTI